MELNNYTKKKLTIDIVQANTLGCSLFLPISLFYIAPFMLIWLDDFSGSTIKHFLTNLFKSISISYGILPIVLFIGGIVLHELIHGITWSFFAKGGLKSIKYGILVKMLTPYCHCKEPLKLRAYILGAMMPALLLGLLPGIIAIATGSIGMLLFAIFFTMAAAGDFMIIQLLWKQDPNSMVLDHPSEAGCYIYIPNQPEDAKGTEES